MLNKAKNSVIGKAHRLGLEQRKEKPVPGRPKTSKKKRVSQTRLINHRGTFEFSHKQDPEKWEPWPETVDLVSFMYHEEHHCRSVEGKDSQGQALYCGRPRVAIKKGDETYYVSSWCREHAKRYYAPHNP